MRDYHVVLLDGLGYELTFGLREGRKAAVTYAKYLLSDAYAKTHGTSHEALGTHKAELRDVVSGECLCDKFR